VLELGLFHRREHLPAGGFSFRSTAVAGEDNNRGAWHALQSWAPAGCGRTTKLLGWLHSALRKLGAPSSPYAIPLAARSLGRCLRLDDIRPGANSLLFLSGSKKTNGG
jgi:hypothetical protein